MTLLCPGLTYDLADSSQHARHADQGLAVGQVQRVTHTGAVDSAEERQLQTWGHDQNDDA